MPEPVSRRTYDRIQELRREVTVAGLRLEYCPCRVLPETVLALKAVLHDVERLWQQTVGASELARLSSTPEGGRFFAGEVRLTLVQEGRPELVAVWLPVPPDYPRRLRVQLIDSIEPMPFPQECRSDR